MGSFEEALQFVLENKINPLTQFMGKISKLDQELDTLNRMKKDIELKLGGLERPGTRRRGVVDKWLKDVEKIEKKRRDIMNQINEIWTYESIDEVFEEVIKEVEKYQLERSSSDSGNIILQSNAIARVKKTIVGIGGIDGASINLTDSPTTFHIQAIQIHNYDRTQGNGADGEGMV